MVLCLFLTFSLILIRFNFGHVSGLNFPHRSKIPGNPFQMAAQSCSDFGQLVSMVDWQGWGFALSLLSLIEKEQRTRTNTVEQWERIAFVALY